MKKFLFLLLSFLMIVSIFNLSVTALSSPSPIDYYKITISNQGDGKVEADKISIAANENDIVTLIATEEKSPFIRWDILGTYEIVQGDLTSKNLQLKPKSDMVIIGIFQSKEFKTNNIKTANSLSPKTGQSDIPIAYIYLIILIICTIIVFIVRKK